VQHLLPDGGRQRFLGVRAAGAQGAIASTAQRGQPEDCQRDRFRQAPPPHRSATSCLVRAFRTVSMNDLQRPGLQQIRDTATGHHQYAQRQGSEVWA